MKVTIIRTKSMVDSAAFKLADTLSKIGFDVTLLIWDRQDDLEALKTDYKLKKFLFKAPFGKATYLFYLPIWWIYEFIYLSKDDSDVIHLCDLDTLIPAIIVKVFRKKKLFYTIYDLYANGIPRIKPVALYTLIKKIVVGIEIFGIGFTDFLFLVDESRYEEVKGARIRNLNYIYNSPPDILDTKKSHDQNKQFCIFYAGLISDNRGIDHIIEAITDLNVKLTVAGRMTEIGSELVETAINKNQLKVEYIGLINYDEVLARTLNSDLVFRFSDPNIPETKTASSNKIFEAMMCGKPIIVSEGSSMSQIVKKENCGIVVEFGNVNEIRDAILKMCYNENLRNQLGKNGRKAYERQYDWKIMEKRLINAYEQFSTD